MSRKSGRRRKEKRKARDRLDIPPAEKSAPQHGIGESGGDSTRTESGRTTIQDGRMLARSIEHNWAGAQRWPNRVSRDEIIRVAATPEGATLINRTVMAAHGLLDSCDEKVKGIGVRASVAMERQNQIDDRDAQGITKQAGTTIINNNTSNANATAVTAVTVQSVLNQLNNDPEYIDYLRDRAERCDAGAVGPDGEPRAVEDAAAPGMAGPAVDTLPVASAGHAADWDRAD